MMTIYGRNMFIDLILKNIHLSYIIRVVFLTTLPPI